MRVRTVGSLPLNRHRIARKLPIRTHDRESFHHRLRDQQPVKRVTMKSRQTGNPQRVSQMDWKNLKPIGPNLFRQKSLDFLREAYPAETGFDHNLPTADRAEPDFVVTVTDEITRPLRQ